LLPFLIVAASLLHLVVLHQDGSGNPLGIDSSVDKVPMYPYFIIKDLLGLLLLIIFFSLFVTFSPNLLGHSDNYIEANPMITPAHIVPE
jgi:ubiquinol-cytochrome c reductase cytochrome b/c1 subunit